MNPLSLLFVSSFVPLLVPLLGVAAALPAQEPASSRSASLQNPVELTADFALVQREPEALWGLGRDYSVRFQDDHVEFLPHLPSSPVGQSLVLHAEAVGRGSSLLPFARSRGPVEQGRTVRYAHAQATEVYDVRPEGMKQSFVFPELPAGEGDLVVTCKLSTGLPLQEVGSDALQFGGEHGGVRLAGVVGIDAAGRRTTGSLALAGDVLSLRLPAAFVASATLPLELDPLLTPVTLATVTSTPGDLQAAYDASTGTYLVVWGGSWFGNTSEVRGYFVPGGPVLIQALGNNRNVDVANNNARDCFVVTWDTPVPVLGGFTRDELRARVVRPGQLGAVVAMPGVGTLSCSEASVASSESPTDDRMLMVHRLGQPYFGGTIGQQAAVLTTFSVTPSLGLFAAVSPSTTISATNVDVSVTGISRSDDGQDRFLVAYGEEFPAGTHRVRSGVFNVQRTAIVPSTLEAPPAGLGVPTFLAIDGFVGNWLVAVSHSSNAGNAVGWRSQATVRNGMLDMAPATLLPGNEVYSLDVASTRRFHAVAHQVFGLPPQVGPDVAGLSLFTSEACAECAGYEEVGSGMAIMPAFARPAANGDESVAAAERIKLFYWNGNAGQLWAADYQPADGIATDLGGGCGNLTATASWACGKVTATSFGATSTFEAALRNAPANAFLVLGTERLDASGCGSCTVVPNPWTGIVLAPPVGFTPGGTVVHTIALPLSSQLVGFRLYQQWLALAPAATGCPSLGLNLSNALRLELQ